MERIVLAYSGGLDTSVAIAWLAETYDAEVIAVTLDLGQGRELTDVRERALAVGAVRAHVLDVREEFARDYILPALQAGALYEDRYPLATALGRPLIARKLVDVARMEGATIVAHGCNGKANDELRLELGVRALDPVDARSSRRRGIWGMSRQRGNRLRQGAADPDPVDDRQSLHGGHQPVGPLDRARRARGPVAGIARGHLRADALAADLSQRARLRRSRVRARACRSAPTASRCRSSS